MEVLLTELVFDLEREVEMTKIAVRRRRSWSMVHLNAIPKPIVSPGAPHVVVNVVDSYRGIDTGVDVVIKRSDNGLDRRSAFVTLTCKRSGKYIPPLWYFKREDTGSRKCECPFKLRDYRLKNNKWRFDVIYGLHRKDLSEKLYGHPIACRLLREEKECVSGMTLNLVQLKNILATLKRKILKNIANIKHVYNRRYQYKLSLRWDRTEMQHLLKLLDDNNYVSMHHRCEDGATTNKYKLPLLEIIGVTSTGKTYSVGFAFLECEKEENFTWALEVCQSMLKDQEEMPKVNVINHDTALMNSVAKVCEKYLALLKYVESIILDQVKEKIVCAWTGQVRHLGNTTTNRVESDHACLKNWLGNSKGDLCADWDSVNRIIQNKHNEIQTSFGCSITVLEHKFKDNTIYSQLVNNISQSTLNYIFHKTKRADNLGSASS
ncbi:uncharacterized protein LOC131649464 [Vicia villosa]|uniref:uncharacterized protein LOC131649464 n=1 Tax=Vicia villosa TaxID=3911 RepID=UPI00273B460C|nr:uncharacterized protein LOC131649464 [Vicia villosa]